MPFTIANYLCSISHTKQRVIYLFLSKNKKMEHLDQTTWLEQYKGEDNAVILDVRTPGEWAEGIIAGAQKLNIMDTQNFVAEIEKMDKSKSYYIYCRSGNRSGQACQIMEQFGFEKTYNLVGGVMEWTGELV